MEPTRATDLLRDLTFIGFCAHWERDRRCPLEFSDYLVEWGLEEQSECAKWAAGYRERPEYSFPADAGPTPDYLGFSSRYRWWHKLTERLCEHADDLWGAEHEKLFRRHDTFPEAIAALLDHFRGYKSCDAEGGWGEEAIRSTHTARGH